MRNILNRYGVIIIGLLGSCFLIILLVQFFFPANISMPANISISLGAPSFDLGSSITITIDKKNIPSDAGLVLSLIRNTRNNPKGQNMGPLMLSPQKIKGTGKEEFIWNGEKTGCAPLDFPTWCNNIKAGSYSIRAIVFDRNDFSLLGRSVDRGERNIIAEYTTTPFYLKGSVDLAPLQSGLEMALRGYLVKQEKLFSYSDTRIGNYLSPKGSIRKIDNGIFCLDQILLEPFSGTLSACTNKSVLSDDEGLIFDPYRDVEATGIIGYSRKLSYQKAEEIAKSTADESYIGRKDYRKGGHGITNWVYRQDGKYWLFVVNEIGDNYADNVLVRLDDDTDTYCIVDTVQYKGGSIGNIFSDRHECKK